MSGDISGSPDRIRSRPPHRGISAAPRLSYHPVGGTYMATGLWRALVITHRYLGIAVGVLMLMWFASGIVMMYVAFPQGIGKERFGALRPIAWQGCCRIEVPLHDNDVFERVEVENLLGRPVLRLRRPPLPQRVIDLDTGAAMEIDFDLAQSIARAAAPRLVGADAPIVAAEEIEDDQWTIGRYRAERPLLRFDFADPAATTLYVSGSGGRVVLRTTASQRFWNWLGAVPHWIYPTALRSNGLLWSRIDRRAGDRGDIGERRIDEPAHDVGASGEHQERDHGQRQRDAEHDLADDERPGGIGRLARRRRRRAPWSPAAAARSGCEIGRSPA
jgi:hypothetical protein